MGKRRQGPINKKVDFLQNKLNKYSIRKFTIGTASILVGATIFFGSADHEAKAAEENQVESITQINEKAETENDVETSKPETAKAET
ncbi:YSIRK-type signal peptide-containing protein, partial [Staphylococcus epidermidis]